jgi:hypothetical protein
MAPIAAAGAQRSAEARRRYFAAITIAKHYVHLGSFATVRQAHAAYLQAKAERAGRCRAASREAR